MLRGRIWSVLALAGGSIVFGMCASASAGLSILSQQVDVDRADQDVIFTLDFNHVPDFKTVDSAGRHVDSFQYEIVPNTSTPISQVPFSSVGAVVRGDEIGSGNVVPIRNGFSNGVDANPAAGGWGTVRGSVPFSVQGNTLSFTAGFNVIGTSNGVFSYRVFTTNFGSTVTTIDSISVPLPAPVPAALVTVAAFAGIGLLRRRFARA
ncbi:MAG TPA: hypothetical protein VFE47_18430 [Tepidisphaeraceae bacterium]|nr:hypothetical protein [Tepidisphaeraceae bacterium]